MPRGDYQGEGSEPPRPGWRRETRDITSWNRSNAVLVMRVFRSQRDRMWRGLVNNDSLGRSFRTCDEAQVAAEDFARAKLAEALAALDGVAIPV